MSCAGEEVERSYTPVCTLETTQSLREEQEGRIIELMVKLYKDGKMSGFLSNLKEGMCAWQRYTPHPSLCLFLAGDEVMVSDPDGTFNATTRLEQASNILLIAAGSGKQANLNPVQ